jgi:hypothetical protein
VSGERFELVVRALPGGGPVEARLRRALKVLLRAFGFRCERAVELPPAAGGGGSHEERHEEAGGP